MSQYYYILNSRPNKPKMKPVKPIHEPSFKCTFVTAKPSKEKNTEDAAKQPKKRTRKKVEEPIVIKEEIVVQEEVIKEEVQEEVIKEIPNPVTEEQPDSSI